jgi:hypothetical protein
MQSLRWLFLVTLVGHASAPLLAQVPNERQREYLNFVKAQAARLRYADKPPATREEWEKRSRDLRDKLQRAFGTVPEKPCPLEPKVLGVLERDGYRVEKLIFQTMPQWPWCTSRPPTKATGARARRINSRAPGKWSPGFGFLQTQRLELPEAR